MRLMQAVALLLLCLVTCTGQGIITTVAGNGSIGFAGDGGPAVNATLGIPQAVVTDAAGNLYIADTLNQRIRRVDTNGVIRTIAGNGSISLGADGSAATGSGIFFLGSNQGLAIDRDGNLYYTDSGNGRIRRVTPGGIVTTVAGAANFAFSGDGGPATAAGFNVPTGVAVDKDLNIYIADSSNARVRKVTAATGTISTIAGNGTFFFSGDGGPATQAGISQAYGVAVDDAGNLYIAEGTGRIRKVNPQGIISTVAGGGFNTFCNYSGAAITAGLATRTVDIDAAGNIYIGDSGGCVRRVDTSGTIRTIAGGGQNFQGDNGPATEAALGTVVGITLDDAGNLHLVDSTGGRVRKVTPDTPAVSPVIAPGGVVNAASFGKTSGTPGASPGSIVSIFGSGFSAGVALTTTVPLPRSLGGTRVLMNGIEAPLFAVTPGPISAQIPWELRSPTVQTMRVQVITAGGASPELTVALEDRAGIFTVLQSGEGPDIITHLDGTLVTAANPATNGEVLVIYCTGLGAVTNTPATGAASPGGPTLAASLVLPSISIGNQPAQVFFAGLTPGFIGLYQVNVQVPPNARPVPGDIEGSVVRVALTQSSLLGNRCCSTCVERRRPRRAVGDQ